MGARLRKAVKWLFILSFLIAGGWLAFDVLDHDGFENSLTKHWCDEHGVSDVAAKGRDKVVHAYDKTSTWVSENVPHYWAKTTEKVGPFVVKVYEKSSAFTVWVVEKTAPVRRWICLKAPIVHVWLTKKLPTVMYYMDETFYFLSEVAVWVWGHVYYAAEVTVHWLRTDFLEGKIVPESLQGTFSSCMASMKNYSYSLYHWCTQLLPTRTAA